MMKLIISNSFLMMIFLMIMISMFMNLISSYNKEMNPLMVGIILLILTILHSLNMNLFYNNYWFSFIMFLIIIGGLMILFLYFTSFIMNMKIMLKWNFFYMFPIKLMLYFFFIMMFIYLIKFSYPMNFNIFSEINFYLNNFNLNFLYNDNLNSLMYLYNKPLNLMTLLLMIYLFFSLTLIVKICLMKKKTIRKIN